jgi:outer membrane protein W
MIVSRPGSRQRPIKEDGMKASKILILIAVSALCIPQVVAGDVTKNDFGVLAGYTAPTSSLKTAGIETKAEGTVDYGLQYRHKFLDSNRLGLGISVLYAQFDVKSAGVKAGTIDNTPVLIDLNWNFLEKRSLFIGVTAGYSMWGNFSPQGGGTNVNTKDNVVYGLNLGWDINLGDHWAILTSLRYLEQKVESDDPAAPSQSVNVNPVVANIGVAFRF